MAEVKVSKGKYLAIIDEEDLEFTSNHTWRLCAGYATTSIPYINEDGVKKYKTSTMHRMLNKTPEGMMTDHKNGNKLDNRRENLRTVTPKQNQMNKKTSKTSTSGLKGIGWCKQTKRWRVSLSVDGKFKNLGRFHCIGKAIKTYNEAANKYHGEYARLNKQEDIVIAVLFTSPYFQAFDSDGDPLSGGKVYTYSAGTTTPKATYTTSVGDVENANPVVLDSAGRAVIFIQGAYKYIIKDSDDNTIETVDNVTSFNTIADSDDSYFESFSGNGTQTAFTLSDDLGTDENTVMVFIDSGLQENVTNGSFATDTDWTKGTGWSIAAGVATAAGAISTALEQTSAVTVVEGQSYALTYTVTRSAGGIIPSIGGNDGTERVLSGTYTEVIVAGSTEDLEFTGNAFTGTLDNISITPAVSKGYDIKNPNTYTLDGTDLTFSTAPADGTTNIFVFAPSKLVGAASASAEASAASATQAASSATDSAASAAKLSGTSTTSITIGTGAKVFTTQASKSFDAGAWLLITSDADPTNYMHGQVTTYSSTTLTMNITNIGGSGTLADWTITVSGTQGSKGDTGNIGDIAGQVSATIAVGDLLVFADVSDSDDTKQDTVGGLLDVNKATANEYTKTQNFNATTLTDASTISWDASANQVASATLAGNRTLGAPTNLKDGATYILTVKQDATGSRTLAYNAVFKFPSGTAPTLSTGASDVDILTFVSDGTNLYGVFQGDFS